MKKMNFYRFGPRLYHLPIFTSLWLFITFLTSYLIAIKSGHVAPLLPYISATGTFVPESCIFGQMLNIASLLIIVTAYVRYKTYYLFLKHGSTKMEKINLITFWMGVLSGFGVSMVANFQETSVIVAHGIGAWLAFGLGGIYCIIQAYMDRMCLVHKRIRIIRIILSALMLPVFVLCMTAGIVAFGKFDGDDHYQWAPENAGYPFHLTATFAEWFNALILDLFFLSYAWDFKQVALKEISFTQKDY